MSWARLKHTRLAAVVWTLLAFVTGYALASHHERLHQPPIHLHIHTDDTLQPRNMIMTNATPATIPEGFMQDAQGRLVPATLVRPIDKLRDQTVQTIIDRALSLNQAMRAFKVAAFSDIAAFIETSAEQFEVVMGGAKGNVTLRSFDGRYKVERAVQESIVFDERLQAAKALIDECITAWSAGASPEIRALVNDAFQVDKEGRISTQRVLGLKRLAIRDEKWMAAMEAIAQSVTVVGSKSYVRVYRREGDTDKYVAIPLDVAAV